MELHLQCRIEVVIGESKIDSDESKSATRRQGAAAVYWIRIGTSTAVRRWSVSALGGPDSNQIKDLAQHGKIATKAQPNIGLFHPTIGAGPPASSFFFKKKVTPFVF
jgi:hypothetical protein